MTTAAKTNLSSEGYDCGECGQRVTGHEFHSYDSCILHRYRFSTLKPEMQDYVTKLGIDVLRERVRNKEAP